MSTQKVTDKIIEDAKKEAAEILSRYKREASKVAEDFDQRTAQKKEQMEKEIEDQRESRIMQRVSQQRLALNMKKTKHRRDLIQKTIDEAVAKLPEHGDYLAFLKNLIMKNGEKEGELLISKHDYDRYRDALQKFLRSEKLNLKITQDPSIKAGLIIKRGTTNYIGTIDIILELLSDKMAITISKTTD